MTEFQVGQHTYKAGKLDAFKQFHVTRRLAPVLAGLGALARGGAAAMVAKIKEDPMGVALPVIEALGKMGDGDCDYVLNTCLSVVQRRQPGTIGWANVTAPGGGLMFEDLDMPDMIQLVWKVLEGNLGNFFGAGQLNLSGGEAAQA